jgi:hypothetical protein
MSGVTPDEYLAAVDERRRPDLLALDALITATAPGLPRVLAGRMIGYGPFHYRYASGREGDATLIALAAQKRYISLYVLCSVDGGYLAERYVDRLPKASIGKSCVRFTRLADVDEGVLRELVGEAARIGPADAAGPS